MPDYRRTRVHGATYFFTVVSHQRQTILTDEPIRNALREAIFETRALLPFKIDAWVLLPDHLHAIWTLPENDSDYSTRWSMIKRGVTKRCATQYQDDSKRSLSRVKRRESTIWQRRFWEHVVRNDLEFEQYMNYVHFNPVKHGLVSRVADWCWSTFHRLVQEALYPMDWGDGSGFDDLEVGE